MKYIIILLCLCSCRAACPEVAQLQPQHFTPEVGNPIWYFHPGDTIIRVSKILEGGGSSTTFRDYPGVFRGISNNLIYIDDFDTVVPLKAALQLEVYWNNWAKYKPVKR